jgi:membrane protease YdiL (CAAX protease family)
VANYLDLAHLGKNTWWRYLASILMIVGSWVVFSFLLSVLLILTNILTHHPNTSLDPNTGLPVGISPLVIVTFTLLSYLPLLASLLFAVRFIHQRPVLSLITPHPKIDWKRLATGYFSFLVLISLTCIVEARLYPGRYQFTFQASEWLKFLPLVLILIPVQAATEELLLRGYLMQSLGLLSRLAIVPTLISSLVFMSLHLANPEVKGNLVLTLVYYFCVGLLFALVTVKDNRLELAIGAHAATNMFVLVVNNSVSVLPASSIFTVTTLDARYNLASFLVIAVIFYAGLFLGRK